MEHIITDAFLDYLKSCRKSESVLIDHYKSIADTEEPDFDENKTDFENYSQTRKIYSHYSNENYWQELMIDFLQKGRIGKTFTEIKNEIKNKVSVIPPRDKSQSAFSMPEYMRYDHELLLWLVNRLGAYLSEFYEEKINMSDYEAEFFKYELLNADRDPYLIIDLASPDQFKKEKSCLDYHYYVTMMILAEGRLKFLTKYPDSVHRCTRLSHESEIAAVKQIIIETKYRLTILSYKNSNTKHFLTF